jgi:hypothetical protein
LAPNLPTPAAIRHLRSPDFYPTHAPFEARRHEISAVPDQDTE